MINNAIPRTDKDIVDEVKETLAMDKEIAEELYSININIDNQTVVLEGEISSQRLRQDIQDMIENVPGVVQVINYLEVTTK